MTVNVREAICKKDLKKFIMFPFDLYRSCPQWVPPLISDEIQTLRKDKNPAFEFNRARYWIAYRDGKPVGRIACIINERYIEKWGNSYARFGWVDFIDDEEVSSALFSTAEEWAKSEGLKGMNGPMGFTDFDKEGLLIEGFDEMGTMLMIYNFPYYPQHIERLGYKKDVDWLEYELQTPEKVPERTERISQIVLKRTGLKLVDATRTKDFKAYAKDAFDVMNKAYSNLYGTVELSKKQIEKYIKRYGGYFDPRFNNILIDKNNRVVAFALAFPSITRALQKARGKLFPIGFIYLLKALKRPKQLDFALVAVRPEYQNKGLPAILMSEVTRSCIEFGIVSCESSGELEDNRKVQSFWKHCEARNHKRRRAYLKLFS